MRKTLAVLALVATAPFACELPPTCEPFGESCPRPDVKRTCPQWSSLDQRPTDETCGDASRCVEDYRSNGTTYAVCAIGERDRRCDRDDVDDTTFCDGERLVRCHGGYREEEVECPAVASGLVCETFEGGASCVRSHEPDARCDATKRSGFCDGDAFVECFGPYAGPARECGRRRVCRVVDGNAHCVSGS